MTTKHCKSCNTEKPLDDFYTSTTTKDGYQYSCKPCCAEKSHNYLRENPTVWMLSNLKKRAADKGVPFNLTKESFVIPERCPVLDIPIRHNKKQAFDSISVDRIVPEKGYVDGNIIIVSDLANRIKTNATPQQIRKVADFYARIYSQFESTVDHPQDVLPSERRSGRDL